jgi:hypothetical protein
MLAIAWLLQRALVARLNRSSFCFQSDCQLPSNMHASWLASTGDCVELLFWHTHDTHKHTHNHTTRERRGGNASSMCGLWQSASTWGSSGTFCALETGCSVSGACAVLDMCRKLFERCPRCMMRRWSYIVVEAFGFSASCSSHCEATHAERMRLHALTAYGYESRGYT